MNTKNYIKVNYTFFGIFLLIGLIFGTLNVLTIKDAPLHTRTFFLIYAYCQSILCVCTIALMTAALKKILPKIFFYLFVGLSFIFFLIPVIDFAVFKIVDITFWEGLDFALDENLENFIEMLHTTGIPLFVWIIIGIIALFLPIIGALLYKLCDKISNIKKLPLHKEHFIQLFFCIPLAIFIWDFKAAPTINPDLYDEFTRTLPWKFTFVQPKTWIVESPLELKKPKSEKEILTTIENLDLKVEKKPNIYIFVIESLRNDFITEDIAPTLYKFKKDNINFERSLSNANATHQSWFSLFYSNFPYLWKYYKDTNWQSGATSLYILKKMGYDINVYSAPELKYYCMKEILFGENLNLTKSFKLFPHYHPKEACDSDIEAINEVEKNLKADKNIYITFFDSTHFLYSWPKNFKTKFTPYADADCFPSVDNVELIKNRYKNAINFTDSLINSFFIKLKEKNLWDDSIIIIVGDHGEEFYEQGNLFHASRLSAEQTNVPIYLKLGKNIRKIPERKLICHMDVFPSIFDYIFGKNNFEEILNGESIFLESKFPFVITTRYNASRSPYEFFIHSENEKLTMRFKKKKQIFQNQHVQILSFKDKDDKNINVSSKKEVLKSFQKAFDRIFKK